MRDDITTALRSGTEEFAELVRPPAAERIRARGDRRRRRLAGGLAALAVLLAAGALTGYRLIGSQAGRGEPALAYPGLGLVAPSTYGEGLPNPVSFTVPGTGFAGTVTVTVDLGHPRYAVYRRPVVLRRDAATGQWLAVPVAVVHGTWRGSYSLRVPGWSTGQRLLVVPAAPRAAPPWGAGRLRIRVTAGGKLLGAQSGPAAVLAPLLGSWRPYLVPDVPRGSTRKLSYTVHNPAALGYRLRVRVSANLCPAAGDGCQLPPSGDAVQWLDGRTWRNLRASAYRDPVRNGEYLGTVPLALPPRGQVTIRLRLVAGAHARSAVGIISLTLTPAADSLPGLGLLYPATPMSGHPGIITLG